MYQIRDLVKTYDKKMILTNLNLDFAPGRFYALLGRNGSGKSTFMRLLAQNELFQKGDIQYKGSSLRSPSLEFARKIAFVNEDIQLPFGEPLEKWAKYFYEIHSHFNFETFNKLMSAFHIDPTKTLESMSRGQKAKAYFSLHASKRPEVYILDEITSVLDSGSCLALMRFLEEERLRGALILMSTNIASELQGYATNLCVLEEGNVAFNSSVTEIEQHFCKVRATDDEIVDKDLLNRGFRYLDKNIDFSWSLLCRRDRMPPNIGLQEDRRGISIHELAIYFTGEVK